MNVQTTKTDVISVTDDNFADVVLNSDRLVVVDFHGNRNPPWFGISESSRRKLIDKYEDRALLAEIDTAQNRKTANAYGVGPIPNVLIFLGAEVVHEFVGTVGIALYGLRTGRNVLALALAVGGVFILIDVKWSSDPVGLGWAFLNGAMFVGYIVLGHKISERGASGGVERLGAAMAIAFFFIMPIGLWEAINAFGAVELVLAGIAVGFCSSVVPYVCDQLAMSRLPRSNFALLLALLPATATIVAAIVLAQIPSLMDVLGVLLVMIGVAVHKPRSPATMVEQVESHSA